MKKINLIASMAIAGIIAGALSPLAYAAENSSATGSGTAGTASIQDSLTQLRKDRQDFNNSKQKEESDKALSLKEKIASRKKAIEVRIAEEQKTKEEKRKAVLSKLIDIQIKQFGNIKERVAKMPNISADLKTQLNTSIQAAIDALNLKKAEVTATTTPEQRKKLAKDIKDLLKAKRDIVKQIVNALLSSRADKITTKAESRLAELNSKIAELKAAGKDAAVIASIETLLADAKTKIDAAKTQTAGKLLKEAAESLKIAYQDIKSAAEKIGNLE